MILIRAIFLVLFFIIGSMQVLLADSHDTTTNQATTETNTNSEIDDDDDLPLNDPFAGNAATGGAIAIPSVSKEEKEERESLYDYKLVGIISGEYENFVSLVNTSGDIRTVGLYEELKKGLKLIDIRLSEAIFQNGEKYLIINFNSEIEEKDEY